MPNNPEPHELSAIPILQTYFHQSITILKPTGAYKRKTANILVDSIIWELKTIFSKRLSKLEDRFKIASHQSKYIIIDLRFAQFEENAALRRLVNLARVHKRVKRVLCIKKDYRLLL